MANLKDKWSQRWPSHITEKHIPTSYWTQDATGNNILHIDLHGFKHEEVRIELASADHIKIEGERIVNDSKCIYIDQTVSLPENSDVDNVVGRFEGDYLLITVPTLVLVAAHDHDTNKDDEETDYDSTSKDHGNAEDDQSSQDDHQNEESNNNKENQISKAHDDLGGNNESTCRVPSFPKKGTINPLEIAIKCLKRNKGVLIPVIISFSIGLCVSNLWITPRE